MGMLVLVTGGSGLLGSHVAEQLALAGHRVRALVRRNSNREFLQTLPGIEFVEGTVEQADRMVAAVAGVDAIVHSAAMVKARSEDEIFLCNAQGTANLLAAAKANAPGLRRFVHVSSLEAVGPSPDGKPLPKGAPRRPVTRYGRSKLAAEESIERVCGELPSTILRPGAIYGPRDAELTAAFKSIAQGVLPILGDGSTKGVYVYAEDCAKACIAAITAEVPSGSAFAVDDGSIYTQREAMEIFEQAVGRRARVRFGLPNWVFDGVGLGVEAYGRLRDKPVMLTREKIHMLRQHWVSSSEETRAALGWRAEVALPEGARRTVAWMRAQRMIP